MGQGRPERGVKSNNYGKAKGGSSVGERGLGCVPGPRRPDRKGDRQPATVREHDGGCERNPGAGQNRRRVSRAVGLAYGRPRTSLYPRQNVQRVSPERVRNL